MNNERATSGSNSTKHRRAAMLAVVTATMLAAAAMLAVPHLSAEASRGVIASMHALWIRIAPPGMQFLISRPTARAFKIWIGVIGACYLARLNYRFVQSL